jgi:Phosphate transporter family
MARMMPQKVMGIITLALLLRGVLEQVEVPNWVIISCALAMGLGTMIRGWRIIRTLGMRIVKIEPVHGFAGETSAAVILLGTAHYGLPVSTTHTIASAIMGVGSVSRFSAVRWGVSLRIVSAWVFTLPICRADCVSGESTVPALALNGIENRPVSLRVSERGCGIGIFQDIWCDRSPHVGSSSGYRMLGKVGGYRLARRLHTHHAVADPRRMGHLYAAVFPVVPGCP